MRADLDVDAREQRRARRAELAHDRRPDRGRGHTCGEQPGDERAVALGREDPGGSIAGSDEQRLVRQPQPRLAVVRAEEAREVLEDEPGAQAREHAEPTADDAEADAHALLDKPADNLRVERAVDAAGQRLRRAQRVEEDARARRSDRERRYLMVVAGDSQDGAARARRQRLVGRGSGRRPGEHELREEVAAEQRLGAGERRDLAEVEQPGAAGQRELADGLAAEADDRPLRDREEAGCAGELRVPAQQPEELDERRLGVEPHAHGRLEGVDADRAPHRLDVAARVVPRDDPAQRGARAVDEDTGLAHPDDADAEHVRAFGGLLSRLHDDGADRLPELLRIHLDLGPSPHPRRRAIDPRQLGALRVGCDGLDAGRADVDADQDRGRPAHAAAHANGVKRETGWITIRGGAVSPSRRSSAISAAVVPSSSGFERRTCGGTTKRSGSLTSSNTTSGMSRLAACVARTNSRPVALWAAKTAVGGSSDASSVAIACSAS